MKNKISNYVFIDCLLVDFGIEKLLSNLYVVVEAYYKLENGHTRKKGLLKIEFKNLYNIHIIKTEEFEFDINLSYDKDGNDVKANEIYSIEITEIQENHKIVRLDSDMLKFEIEFREVNITELLAM